MIYEHNDSLRVSSGPGREFNSVKNSDSDLLEILPGGGKYGSYSPYKLPREWKYDSHTLSPSMHKAHENLGQHTLFINDAIASWLGSYK